MIPWLDLVLIPVSIGFLLTAMALVKWLGAHFSLEPEIQRKCVHIATGLYALTLPATFQSRLSVIMLLVLSVALLLALRLPLFARAGIASAIHSVERKSFGEIYLVLAVGGIFWFSPDNAALYALPILVLTLSDAAAALAGTRYGRMHFQVEAGTKSWEGVTIFFLVTWILSMVALLLMSEINRANVVVLSVMIAAFGALVEADSWGGLDNLFVPVGIHILLARHWDTPIVQLAVLALAFFATLYAVMRLSGRFGLSQHSARAYVVLIFLICGVTTPENALLPVLVVFAHIAARRWAPCASPYPDLDLVAVATGIALFWLFIGEFFARNALNVYNMTFAAMAVIFVGVAGQHLGWFWRLVLVASAALVSIAILTATSALNPGSQAWTGPVMTWSIVSLACAGIIALSAPTFFNRHRSARAMVIAAPTPLLLFAIRGLAA